MAVQHARHFCGAHTAARHEVLHAEPVDERHQRAGLGPGVGVFGPLAERLRFVGVEVLARWPSEAVPRFIVASTGAGGLVAWREAGCLFGAQFGSSSGLVRALARLMRRT